MALYEDSAEFCEAGQLWVSTGGRQELLGLGDGQVHWKTVCVDVAVGEGRVGAFIQATQVHSPAVRVFVCTHCSAARIAGALSPERKISQSRYPIPGQHEARTVR